MRFVMCRKYSVEILMAKALEALGHQVFFRSIEENFESFVNQRRINYVFLMNNTKFYQGEQLKNFVKTRKVIYWERQHRPKFLRPDSVKYMYRYFTIYDDNSGIYLPCAANDSSYLKQNNKYGITLVSATKRIRPIKDLQIQRLRKEAEKKINFIDKIPYQEYDKRYEVFANSLASINVWNEPDALPLRSFEIPAAKTPMLSYQCDQLEKHFTPGEHYYETDNMADAIDYCKSHPEEMKEMAARAHEHVLRHHTYKHRAQFVLDHLK